MQAHGARADCRRRVAVLCCAVLCRGREGEKKNRAGETRRDETRPDKTTREKEKKKIMTGDPNETKYLPGRERVEFLAWQLLAHWIFSALSQAATPQTRLSHLIFSPYRLCSTDRNWEFYGLGFRSFTTSGNTESVLIGFKLLDPGLTSHSTLASLSCLSARCIAWPCTILRPRTHATLGN